MIAQLVLRVVLVYPHHLQVSPCLVFALQFLSFAVEVHPVVLVAYLRRWLEMVEMASAFLAFLDRSTIWETQWNFSFSDRLIQPHPQEVGSHL